VARESATQSFDNAARALNIDWGTSFDGKQIERWGESLGQTLVEARQKELQSFQAGVFPVRDDEAPVDGERHHHGLGQATQVGP